jgi:glycine/D-amino acid oxidase-like deaminating enzyme
MCGLRREQTGGLDFAVNDNPDLLNLLDACKKEGVEHAVLTPAQLRERFPLVHLPEDYTAVLNPEAGMLNATKVRNCSWIQIRPFQTY